MSTAIMTLLTNLKDPKKEVDLIRKGIKTAVIEAFLNQEGFLIKDILSRLGISASTYFAKKKNQKALDTYMTEKFVRLIQVTVKATHVLGEKEAKDWLYRPIPSLDNQIPIDLLDTEAGHRLVEQTLLQIEHGVYN